MSNGSNMTQNLLQKKSNGLSPKYSFDVQNITKFINNCILLLTVRLSNIFIAVRLPFGQSNTDCFKNSANIEPT